MDMFLNSWYNNFLKKEGVVGLKDKQIKLKSGKMSWWYANFRNLSQSKKMAEDVAEKYIAPYVFSLMNSYVDKFDWVVGVPEGATILGDKAHEELIRRGDLPDKLYKMRLVPKEHGDAANKYWVNGNVPKSALVLEDVTTTGGSAISFIEWLEAEKNVKVVGLVGMLNRLQLDEKFKTVPDKLEEMGIPYFAMSDASKILPIVCVDYEKGDEYKQLLNDEYKKEYAAAGKNAPFSL